MRPAQLVASKRLIERLVGDESNFAGHHGDCLGADAQFHDIVRSLGGRVVVHPGPEGDVWRARKIADETRPPKGHLARNRDIVQNTDYLIATPREETRQDRGGTWYTHDYGLKEARKRPYGVYLVTPSGEVVG